MCGLHGWVGKDPKQFNMDKFNVLGIINETRGVHSCGIAVDGELFKGHLNNRMQKWREMIAGTNVPVPENVSVVIGHTRAATGGSPHTEKNAHPFKFDLPDGNHFIGAHNGVIRNYEALGKEYGIEDIRNKIDSHVLLEIIANYRSEEDCKDDHNDNDQVFVKYIGAAALLMYNSKDPDTLWVFRGESHDPGPTNYRSELIEERPLWFYQESEDSMYICSLPEALRAIADDPSTDDIKEFRTNTLYQIKAGKIEKRFEIDRTKTFPPKRENTTPANGRSSTTSTNSAAQVTLPHTRRPATENTGVGSGAHASARGLVNAYEDKTIPASVTDKTKDYMANNIFYENVIFSKLETDIYFENLRYKRNGHLCNGYYLFLEECGFVKLCDEYSQIHHSLNNFNIYYDELDERITFPDVTNTCRIYAMYKGILMKTVGDYEKLMEIIKRGETPTTKYLARVSEYPIIDWTKYRRAHGKMKGEKGTKERVKVYPDSQCVWWKDGNFNGWVQPIGSYRNYNFEIGNLKEVVSLETFNLPKVPSEYLSVLNDGSYGDAEEPLVSFEDAVNDELAESKDMNISHLIDLKDTYINTFEYTSEMIESMEPSKIVKTFKEFNEDNINKFKPLLSTIEGIEKTLLTKS